MLDCAPARSATSWRFALSLAIVLAFLTASATAYAQRPDICGPGADMEIKCVDACIICDIDGFRGRNDNGAAQDEGDFPGVQGTSNAFCTTVNHNIQWIGFMAVTRELNIRLDVSNCEKGDGFSYGLEVGVFEVSNCDLANAIRKNCNTGINNNMSGELVMDDLVPGQFYYLVIDGNFADICDYQVNVTKGSTEIKDINNQGNLVGFDRVCANTPFTYTTQPVESAVYYDWTLDGVPIGTETDLQQTLTFPTNGTYELCVTASNLCARDETCLTINVGDAVTEIPLTGCPGIPVVVDGRTITETSIVTVNLKTEAGCDSTVIYDVTIGGDLSAVIDTTLCVGPDHTIKGVAITTAGDYPFPSKTKEGCDSTTIYRVRLTDVLRGTADTTFCTGGDFEIHGQAITAAGEYDFDLKTRDGCDSIVTYTVVFTDPPQHVVDTLLCAEGPHVILGRTITSAGPQTFSLETPKGCDSVVTYNIAFAETPRRTVDTTICPSITAIIRGQDISAAGTYDFPVSAAVGCDSILTYKVSVAEAPRRTVDTTICPNATATIRGQDISAAGTYDFPVSAAVGCDSILTYNVSVAEAPRRTVDTTICPNATATIYGQAISAAGTYDFPVSAAVGCDSVLTYIVSVSDPILTRLTETICVGKSFEFDGQQLTEAGNYSATYPAKSGCDSTVELTLSIRSCGFAAGATASPTTCAGGSDGTIDAYVVGPAPPYTVFYAREGGSPTAPVAIAADSTPTTFVGLPAGRYLLTFTDRFGFSESTTTEVTAPSPLRVVTRRLADGAFDIRCAGSANGQMRAVASGGTPPYSYRWSTGSTSDLVSDLEAQALEVTVTDANGCTARVGATITEPPRLELDIQAIDQGCDPVAEPGGIRINNIAGGRLGYRLRINGQDLGAPADRYDLPAGTHTITLVDAAACSVDTSFYIDELTVPEVGVDSVWRIDRGERAQLSVATTGEIISYYWTGPTSLSCEDCPSPWVAPERDATYEVTVTNTDGCEARTELLVLVRIDRTLFAPTAISPNGDGVNDGFTVFVVDEGSVIEELQVFDRWGERMFVATDILPGDTATGWDGTFRGQEMDPAVFVYWARVRNSDGETDMVKGDFTLLR